MKTRLVLVVSLLFGVDYASSVCADEREQPDSVAYIGATLIDGTGGPPIEGAVLLVKGTRIVSVGKGGDIAIPVHMRRIDVSNAWIMPGLIDTHVHFFESGRLYFNPFIAMLFGDLVAEDRWVKQRLDYTLGRYLCAGVTTAVSLGGPASFELLARERSRLLEYAPEVLVAGGPIAENGVEWMTFDGQAVSLVASNEEEIRQQIRDLHAMGMDLIKLGYLGGLGSGKTIPLQEYLPVLAAAADEAHKLGLPVITHISSKSVADALLGSGLDAYAHLPSDMEVDDAFIQNVIANNIAIAPTLSPFKREWQVLAKQLTPLPIEQRCADPQVTDTYDDFYTDSLYGSWSGLLLLISFAALINGVLFWRWTRIGKWTKAVAVPLFLIGTLAFYLSYLSNFARTLVWATENLSSSMVTTTSVSAKRLFDAGATLIVGSDSSHVGTPHGTSIHVEMQMIQEAGIPARAIIAAASKNAAEVLGIANQTGTLQAGKQADFLVLDADPLRDITNAQQIRFVVIDGDRFDADELSAATQ